MDIWTIRRADLGDADGLAECIDVAYAEFTDRITDLPPMSDDCAAEIAGNQVWLADADAGIVGALVLSPRDGFMMLANVAVRPDARGAGLGRRLLQLAEAEAADQGYAQMRLNTHAGLKETIGIYLRNGWSEIGRSGNRITMRKVLAN